MQPMFWVLMGFVCLVSSLTFVVALTWACCAIGGMMDERLGLKEGQRKDGDE